MDFYTLTAKPRSKESALGLLNIAIHLANEIGAPKSTPLSPHIPLNQQAGNRKSATASGSPISGNDASGTVIDMTTQSEDSQQGSSEDRMAAVEKAIQDLKKGTSKGSQVEEAIRQISVLAGRPKLTSPAVIIAAVESNVDVATRTSDKNLEYYCKALQACRRFETSPDLCSLCLRQFGSQEDKKISAAIAERTKQQKYEDPKGKYTQGTGNIHGGLNSQGIPQYQFWPQMWMPPNGQNFAPNMPYLRPYPAVGEPIGNMGRPRMGGLCFFCNRKGHFVAKCPKLNGAQKKIDLLFCMHKEFSCGFSIPVWELKTGFDPTVIKVHKRFHTMVNLRGEVTQTLTSTPSAEEVLNGDGIFKLEELALHNPEEFQPGGIHRFI